MKHGKILSVVLSFSLLASSFGGFGVTSVKESRASEKRDEYLIQVDNPAVYSQIHTEMKNNDSEVVKHTKEDEAYLAENKAMVVSLTKSEAAELKEEQGVTVEKDATVRGSEITDDGLIYAEPEEIDLDAYLNEDEYTTDATGFEPREDVTDPDKKDEIVPWNISCVAGTPHENQYKGEKVKVAVLDSGIDMHDEFYTRQWVDFSDTVNGYKPTDNNGHGTMVAGPIAARISGFGMEGIASGAELYSVKILDKENEASVSTVVKAIEWCIQNDMDVINMSFGMDSYSEILADAVKKAYNNDILMVAAAGNDVKQVQYPARFPEVLSVGSINSKLETSEFSDNSQTDLAAPGEDVQSTGFLGSYTKVSGTSLAAAHVTGVAAAVKSADTSLTASQLMEVLKGSAVSLGADGKLVNYENAVALAREKENLPVTKSDVAEITQEKAEDEECHVKGSWSTYPWSNQNLDVGHYSLTNSLVPSYFKGANTAEQVAYRNIVAEAVRMPDILARMSASGIGNSDRDAEGNILSSSSSKMYSPYHAKSQYSLDEVKQHILFLYELARRRIMLGEAFSETISDYYGDNYKGVAISQKMQRRIVKDIIDMKDAKGKDSQLEWDMPSKLKAGRDSVLAEGYMILGVFLHLVQDLQSHRAKVDIGMIKKADGTYYEEDSFDSSASGSHISKYNLQTGNKRQELITNVQSTNGLPFIRLKDYLCPGVIVFSVNGKSYSCTLSQAYEDNPYFFSHRFSTAQAFSASYMTNMLRDTADKTNRTTYLTNIYVPLV